VTASTAPSGKEYNINVNAALFPYANYTAGYARNSAGTPNGPNDLLTSSAGIALGNQFVDNGDGTSTLNLTGFGINSQTDGVLLVSGGANDNDYALSQANTNGTWTLFTKDNATNGAVWEEDAIAFVFIPKTNMAVISGKFQGDGSIVMYSGTSPRFTVSNTGTGIWQLSIPGYSPKNGVLIISPEAGNAGQDNIWSSQPSGNNWIIQSRDLPGLGLQTPSGAVISFVFIPSPIATLVSPADGATGIASSPSLTVNVTNSASGNLSVAFAGHDAGTPFPGKDFLICILPDTQNYAREASGIGHAVKEMWFSQTDWILSHRYTDNVAYVGQLGDIVQDGDTLNGSPNDTQWEIATNAMYRLEDQTRSDRIFGIPYGCCVGNHDQEPNGDQDGTTTHYNRYFGTAHFSAKPYYGGHYDTNSDNFFDLFSVGGLDFIVFSYEFNRSGPGVLGWTENVLATNQNRRIIVMTHYAGGDCGGTSCGLSPDGQNLYDGLKSHPNFFLMMGGHVFNGAGDGEGRRTDTFNGNTVHTLISDYQGRTNGGDGLMRLMYFSPSNNTVSVKTYSPWTDSFETDGSSQFSFGYNMQLPTGPGSAATAYTNIAVITGLASGAQTSTVWDGLQASRTYEWYVAVTNEVGDYGVAGPWRFTTSSGFAPNSIMQPGYDYSSWAARNGIVDANADDDHDGQSNYAEYLAGTDPHSADSVFQIVNADSQLKGFTLSWSSVGGKRYRVQYSDDLSKGFTDLQRDAQSETDSSPAGQASQQTFTDPAGPTNSIRWYRVMLVQ
jgi:hypothetical protein